MKIVAQCVVSLSWTLKDTLGETLDTLDEPVEFLLGGNDLLTSIETALQDHSASDVLELHLEPEEAFGEYNESLVFLEPRSAFPAGLEEGMVFDGAAMPAGTSTSIPTAHVYLVTDVYPEHVVLDGNHPLAGIALRLRLTVNLVREATLAELGRGSLGTGFFRLEAAGNSNSTLH